MNRFTLGVYLLLTCTAGYAEFYVWYDERGTKHISTVPGECITAAKTVSPTCPVLSGDGAYLANLREQERLARERWAAGAEERAREREREEYRQTLEERSEERSKSLREVMGVTSPPPGPGR